MFFIYRTYGSVTTMQCIKDIYNSKGLLGFYKGITASYFGISETIIHFVIYEFIKAKLHERRPKNTAYQADRKSTRDFVEFMCAGAISKTCASSIAYPHGKLFHFVYYQTFHLYCNISHLYFC